MLETTSGRAVAASARLANAFRSALRALSEPGIVAPLPRLGDHDGATSLSPAARTLLALLSDHDARWRLSTRLSDAATREALTFDTGAAPAPSVASASFLVGDWTETLADHVPHASIGDPEYPDRSATLIVEASGLRGESGGAPIEVGAAEGALAATLSGPGIKHTRAVAVAGVDARFWPWIGENAARFPLGFDVFLTAGDAVMGLPRSVRAAPKLGG